MKKEQLKRTAKQLALQRLEEAARTIYDFEQVADMYDKLDGNRERKERYWEEMLIHKMVRVIVDSETIIPPPRLGRWWRQTLRGEFLDDIFDCPFELGEMTSSPALSRLVDELDESRKEILYYWAIRLWSPQAIAAYRGQTDRNIRKVYNTMIGGIRKKLHERLAPRYHNKEPLTLAQKQFVKRYEDGELT
ncbi:hypothetical protein FACS189492_0060 [Clostridia bacterium]|nr:hypothetical protein FACS189492_0060 [Clostridia bacterium]